MARTLSLITGDPDRGTEFAQEAFARAYPRWSRFATAEHARRWLFRTGINLSRSAWRKERRSLPVGLGPANSSPFVDASVEDRIAIRQALARVSPRA